MYSNEEIQQGVRTVPNFYGSPSGKTSFATILNRRELLRAAAALGAWTAAVDLTQAQAPAAREPETIYPANFKRFKVDTSVGATITGVIGGSGPPVLLMHGAPLTHASWSQVAPALARDHTVVATDLRGYGDSGKLVVTAVNRPVAETTPRTPSARWHKTT